MSYLFEVNNNIATPNTETLLISPFKEIWNRDKTISKEVAIKEFTFIELMTSKKRSNPYAGYSDDVRLEKLKELLFKDVKNWKPDKKIEEALKYLDDIQKEASPTYSYYLSVIEAVEKMKKFFKDFNFNERTDKGVPIYKPADITRAISDTDNLLQNLNSMKEKVEQELFEATKTRSNKQINPFEE